MSIHRCRWTTTPHPEEFLLSAIADPAVSLPKITVTSVTYLDPSTGKPLAANQLVPGQSVRVHVTATNAGLSLVVVAGLRLDSDSIPANGIVYDSHLTVPGQDIQTTFAPGTKTFDWTWQVPASAAVGQYYADLQFHDQRYVLGFKDSGWQQAFSVAAPASVLLVDKSIAATPARDGQTITLGYQISASAAATAVLDASLISPQGQVVSDLTHDGQVQLVPGTQWYSRDFTINLPPQAAAGAYDVVWKLHIVGAADESLTGSGALTISATVPVRVPILMYHNIGTSATDNLTVTPAAFQQQVQALKAHGYTTVTLQDVLNYRAGSRPRRPSPWCSRSTTAIKACSPVCIPCSRTVLSSTRRRPSSSRATCAMRRLPAGAQPRGCPGRRSSNWRRTGLVDIESHTVNHPYLTRVSAAQLTTEVTNSKQVLESQLGKRSAVFRLPVWRLQRGGQECRLERRVHPGGCRRGRRNELRQQVALKRIK